MPERITESRPVKVTLLHHAIPEAEVLFQEVGGEAVLLSLARERYFALDPVGTRIWRAISRDPSLQVAFDALLAEYDVDPARLEADLLALVGQLSDAGLVQIGLVQGK